MKYVIARIKGQLDKLGELEKPIELPEGTIVLSYRKNIPGTVIELACLVPVKEE